MNWVFKKSKEGHNENCQKLPNDKYLLSVDLVFVLTWINVF